MSVKELLKNVKKEQEAIITALKVATVPCRDEQLTYLSNLPITKYEGTACGWLLEMIEYDASLDGKNFVEKLHSNADMITKIFHRYEQYYVTSGKCYDVVYVIVYEINSIDDYKINVFVDPKLAEDFCNKKGIMENYLEEYQVITL